MTGATGDRPASRWSAARRPSAAEYDARWDELRAAGVDPHGEATFVAGYRPRRVLDAGCGSGRVAVELDRRGVEVVGVDLDEGFVAAARAKAPHVEWHHDDLATVRLAPPFDLVVAAGNVMIFLAPGSEGAVVANLAGLLVPAGRLVAGFALGGDRLTLDRYDELAARSGLSLEERFATWARDPFTGGDYAVSVHRRRA